MEIIIILCLVIYSVYTGYKKRTLNQTILIINDELTRVRDSFDDLMTKSKQILAECDDLVDKNNKLEKKVTKLDSALYQVDELKLKNADLRDRNTDLNQQIKTQNSDISELKREIKLYSPEKFKQLESKNSRLIEQYSLSTTKNHELAKTNVELHSKFTDFENTILGLQDELKGLENVKLTYKHYIDRYDGLMILQRNIDKLNEINNKGKDHYLKIKEGVETQKKNYEIVKNNVVSLNTKLTYMKNQLSNYEEDLYKHESKYSTDDYDLYKYIFTNETPDSFKEKIEDNYIKGQILFDSGLAVIDTSEKYVGEEDISFNRRSQNIMKNMINLFNAECNQIFDKLTIRNVNKMIEKLNKVKDNINKINKVNANHYYYISDEYYKIKIDEIQLKFEFETAKQKYKDEQDAIKAQMREEQREEKKLVKEREIALKAAAKAEKEEHEFEYKLRIAREELEATMAAHLALKEQEDKDKFNAELQEKDNEAKEKELAMNEMISKLEEDLRLAQEAKERNKSMAQQTRSGYVYIISNVGSFGDGVVKIGMTRRLEPMDRVKELGDASVPFGFDVHALIYSKDAPALENELHKQFADNRVNLVNLRKEFFNVHVNDVSNYLLEKGFDMSKMNILPDASEYYESMSIRKMADENGVPVSSIVRDNSINNMFEFVDEEENEEAA